MENQWNQKFVDHEQKNNISLEQYQQSIALMNSDLHDIQEDIQKLAEQQNQIQVQTMQAQQLLQAQQIANILNHQYSSQQNITGIYHPLPQQSQQYGSTPQLSAKPPVQNQYINEQGQYVNQKVIPDLTFDGQSAHSDMFFRFKAEKPPESSKTSTQRLLPSF